jgi:translation initiation factor 2 subunit 2
LSPKTTTKRTASPKEKTKAKPKAATKAKPKPKPKTKAKQKTKAAPKTRKVSSSKEVKTMDYETLLHRARDKIPPEVFEQPRFKIPKVDSIIQGARTVIRNFKDIADVLRRDPNHLLRYLAHELATAGELHGRQAIFNGRFLFQVLEELVERYANEYVLCPICNRPDTEIKREERLIMLVCSACGGRTPLKGT